MIDNALCLYIIVNYADSDAILFVNKRAVEVMRANPAMFSQTRPALTRDFFRRIVERSSWIGGVFNFKPNCVITVKRHDAGLNANFLHFMCNGATYLSIRRHSAGTILTCYHMYNGKNNRCMWEDGSEAFNSPVDMMRMMGYHNRRVFLPPLPTIQ